MSIPIRCDCGKSLKVKDEAAGRKVRCPGCGVVLPIPKPEIPKEADEQALDYLLAEGPPPAKKSGAKDHFTEKAPPIRPKAAPIEKKRSVPSIKKRYPREKRYSRDGGRMPFIVVNPSIITGVAMMGGAVIWFVAGLYANRVFFYPPGPFLPGYRGGHPRFHGPR
jgi:hypothetical protein